jgi:thiazole synthase ThiGH ThiG subunit
VKWNEVRKLYSDQWIKLEVLNSHVDHDYLFIDEMDVIKTIENDKAATLELTKSTLFLSSF